MDLSGLTTDEKIKFIKKQTEKPKGTAKKDEERKK